MKLAAAALVIGATVLSTRPVRADDGEAGRLARLAVARARRAVALGPSAGGSVVLADGSVDGTVSFGLALSLFKIKVIPDRAAVEARAKVRLKEAVAAAIAEGRPLTGAELEEVARKVYRDVVDEFTTERKPKRLERPRARLVLEAARSFDQGDWSSRLGAGLGVGPVSLGGSLMTLFAADTTLYLGPELSLQLLPGKGPRSPIIDVFLRADFAVAGDDTHLYGAGVRAILDVI